MLKSEHIDHGDGTVTITSTASGVEATYRLENDEAVLVSHNRYGELNPNTQARWRAAAAAELSLKIKKSAA